MRKAAYNLYPPLLGHIKNWKKEIDKISSMGFEWVYINPITYPGFSGSLYATKDYYLYNENYFTSKDRKVAEKEITDFTKYCASKNIKVMLDLVINHSSKDSILTETNKNWYKLDDKGELVSPGAFDNGEWVCWGDLASFDNENSIDKKNLWEYWYNLIKNNIGLGIKGFRCDAAYKVPSELWKYLISSAKKIDKDIVFFAESLGCSFEDTMMLSEAQFDYLASSARWWDFKSDWFLDSYNKVRLHAKQIAFPENHDTMRCITEFDGNIFRVKQISFLTAIVCDMWMITTGYEYGFFKRCDVVNDRPKDYEPHNYDITDYIKRLIEYVKDNSILANEGEIEALDIIEQKEIKEKIELLNNSDTDNNKKEEEIKKYEELLTNIDNRIFRAFYKYSLDKKNKLLVIVNTTDKKSIFEEVAKYEIKEDISFENRLTEVRDKIEFLPYEIKVFVL